MIHFYTVMLSILLLLSLNLDAQPLSQGIIPTPRLQNYDWMTQAQWQKLHAEDVLIAKHDKVDVLFIGDSITAGWPTSIWQTYFASLGAANFAIGGDHTGNVLWRLQHGLAGHLQPKLVVVMIGVNNLGGLNETPVQAADGVKRVLKQIQIMWPQSQVLLNGVLPFEASAKSPKRAQVRQLNQQLKTWATSQAIIYRDYGYLMVNKKGDISADIMADYLHPTEKGYRLWLQALLPDIQALLKQSTQS